MDTQTLATELLHEIKHSAKRWFYAFIVMVLLEVITIGTFFWYISLPVDTYTTQVSNDSGELNFIGNDGDINGRGNNYINPPSNEVETPSGK